MPLLKPDPTFYPSPRLAMQSPPEKHAFVAALNPPGSKLHAALLVSGLLAAAGALTSLTKSRARPLGIPTWEVVPSSTPSSRHVRRTP